ncbi:ribonuclease VapC [Brevundimonas intermedia]|uniref:Ribonuclease VapC n=1 Tax=Brevundimonas intermedia TaxID=74315 RepID=A0ABQ5TE14_9CAUL|nr:type II toxin-antitoxin system VapC family toxin [Brevundimonas intermedia]GLK50461.1 ribonuclease VapC [Brevundimonas intermedia]
MIDYFDASALAAILFSEPAGQSVVDHTTATEADLLVSDFVVAEVSSAISRLVRMRARTADQGDHLLGNLDDWVNASGDLIDIHPTDVREATALVRQFDLKLRAPDALHIAICRRIDARLITLDNNLAAAAQAVGLPCMNPAESSAV